MVNRRDNALARQSFDHAHGFNDLIVVYRRHLRARGLADGTVTQRVLHVEALHAAHPDVLSVTTEDMEQILSRRLHTHAPESRRSMRSSWQSFYAWAKKAGHLEQDPAMELAPIRLPRAVARIADDEKVLFGLVGASARDAAMVLLGRLAGLRLTEITTLHTRDREDLVLRVRGKGSHVRMVPINSELLEVLLRLERIQGDGYYFRGGTGGHLHPQSVSKIITKLTDCNPHSLRHAAATAAYDKTRDLRGLQEFLGHASLATTERYVHVKVDQIRNIADATSLQTTPAG
jgi:site-specific recombinase XerD